MPVYTYRRSRPSLDDWARLQGEDGLEAYRRKENMVSIDGSADRMAHDEA